MGAASSLDLDIKFLNKYSTPHHLLGKGGFGDVYGPIQRGTLQLAIKQIMFADGKDTDESRRNVAEKQQIWSSLDHRNLTKIYSVNLDQLPKAMYIVMEYASGGSLDKTLRSLGSERKLPIYLVTDWAKQIAAGMRYLNERDIVHRDLKPSNILLMTTFDVLNPQMKMTLKIADFDEVKEHDYTITMSLVGTCSYAAPEVLTTQRFSKASDVWSYGVLIWEMLTGDIPHKGLQSHSILARAQDGTLHNLPIEQSFPESYKSILNRCWKTECRNRPSFDKIISILRRMDEYAEDYESDPVLIHTIGTKEGKKSIAGMTILDKELFVVTEEISEVEVYDSMNLSVSRSWNLKELVDPLDIGSCSRNKCLYILNRKRSSNQVFRKSNEVLRVDPNGKLIQRWSTGDDYAYGGLSVSAESTVILCITNKNKVNEYSSDGRLIREINLLKSFAPRHAIKMTNGHFVVCQFFAIGKESNVCTVTKDGELINSLRVKSKFGGVTYPVNLAVDGNGFVLVAVKEYNRVLLYDSNLEFKRVILLKEKQRLTYLRRILLDESNGRLFVAEDDTWRGHISLFQF